MITDKAILLLLLLLVCHWIADFSHLSTLWMLKAKKHGTPLLPILIHACIHGLLMFAVLVFFCDIKLSMILMCIQIISHFLLDVLKGKIHYWFPLFEDSDKRPYWYLLGLDQLMHQFVIVIMVWIYIVEKL